MCTYTILALFQELIAKSEGLTRRAKDASPAPIKKEPLTLSSLRAAAGNTSKPNAKKAINAAAPPPAAPASRPAAHKKPEKVLTMIPYFKGNFERSFIITEQCSISFRTQTT